MVAFKGGGNPISKIWLNAKSFVAMIKRKCLLLEVQLFKAMARNLLLRHRPCLRVLGLPLSCVMLGTAWGKAIPHKTAHLWDICAYCGIGVM